MEKQLKLPLTGLDLSFESHEASGFPKFPALCNKGPTIPQVHYYHNDVAVYARFCHSLGGGFRSAYDDDPWPDRLNDELLTREDGLWLADGSQGEMIGKSHPKNLNVEMDA